jgi:YbbR domain-containing protein
MSPMTPKPKLTKIEKIKENLYENGSYKVVALLITMILWITVLGNKDQILNQNLKLNFILPKNKIIANGIADQAQVQISGSRLSLKKLAKGLDPIDINLEDAKPGRTIVTIPTDKIILPFGAQIVSVNPATLVVDIDQVTTKRVPVRITWDSDEEPQFLRVTQIKPATIMVKGASSVLSRIQEVWTDPISPLEVVFDKSKKSVEFRVGLKEFSYFGILPTDNRNVTVTLQQK